MYHRPEWADDGTALLQTLLVSLDHLLDHLAADGACLAGGQVTVVAVLQVYANFLGSLHLEAIHSFSCLGHIDLIAVLVAHIALSFIYGHTISIPMLSWKDQILSEESIFLSATVVLPNM